MPEAPPRESAGAPERLADPSDFEQAYAALWHRASSIAASVLHDRDLAQDVAQEVFLTIWRRPGGFDAGRGSLSTYVSLLARSRAIDRLRAEAVRPQLLDQAEACEDVGAVDDPSRRIDAAETCSALLGALGSLPREQREALLLAYGAGLTSAQIACATGRPLGTAKSRVRLGMRRLRRSSGELALEVGS